MVDSTVPRGSGAEDAPERIGPFRVLERIGEGGMGVVYLAERREPIEQRVALKVIRTGRLDKTYRARFAMEQSALARMDHPHIARLLDAGDDGGQSWFAMEHVPGVPLSAYCREHRLSIEARLQLFTQICDGVQHAHGKGILHRDLKPGNILVREIDGRPFAKIIDFGLAQPIDPLQIRATLHESLRQVVGTIAYMSPEQAQRTEGDLDIRTDVYSLGVVLYELLTGEVPMDVEEMERRGLPWLGEFLREYQPKKPSTRLSDLGDRLSTTAAERGVSVGRLRSRVRGDLDWVTMRALERDRQRRYVTVRELGRDVERWLRDEPVEAGPPSGWYVARKWLRRHVRAVAVAAAVAVAFGGMLVAGNVYAGIARAAEQRRDLVAAASHAARLVEQGRHELWPAEAARIPALQEWRLLADRCVARELEFLALREELLLRIAVADDRASTSVLEAQVADLSRGIDAIGTLRELVPRLEARQARAAAREAVSFGQPGPWQPLADRLGVDVADLRQLGWSGLVPLGENPRSKLLEFYLPESGAPGVLPVRLADGGFRVDATTGLIFVWIPGGEFVAPTRTRATLEQRRRQLAPFLIAKYEMTQAQWARLLGEGLTTPAALRAKVAGNEPDGLQHAAGEVGEVHADGAGVTFAAAFWSHPVQQVSWEDAEQFLRRWSLQLPTVAQWWWAANGHDERELQFAWLPQEVGRSVNFADDVRLHTLPPNPQAWRGILPGAPSASWDGFFYTNPVGALADNPFGLHDVFGNVAELCGDGYEEPWPSVARAGDGFGVSALQTRRTMAMGSSFDLRWSREAAVQGHQVPIGNISDTVGLRPVFRYLK